MWLERDNYCKIRTAVHVGRPKELDKVLQDIIIRDNGRTERPADCPACGKPLIRRALPYLEFFVNSCPDFHGVWMSPEISRRLKDFLREQISIAGRKAQSLKIFLYMMIGFFCLFLLHYTPDWVGKKYSEISSVRENLKISENYWPIRDPRAFPVLPFKESGIQDYEETLYLQQWSLLAQEAVGHRMNIDAVMQTHRRPEKYWSIFQYYAQKQQGVTEKLSGLSVPKRLKNFHALTLSALESQMIFYAAFAKAKSEDPSLLLSSLLKHPALTRSRQELHEIYSEFLRLYPSMSPEAHDAVERRLYWLDIV